MLVFGGVSLQISSNIGFVSGSRNQLLSTHGGILDGWLHGIFEKAGPMIYAWGGSIINQIDQHQTYGPFPKIGKHQNGCFQK